MKKFNYKKLFLPKNQKFVCKVIEDLFKKHDIKDFDYINNSKGIFYLVKIVPESFLHLHIKKEYLDLSFNLRISHSIGTIPIDKNKTQDTIKNSILFYLENDLIKINLIKNILEKC